MTDVNLRDEHGVALLEVLVALTVLSWTALSLVGVLRQAMRAQAALRVEETSMDTADRVLAALTLLGRKDLDRRIGRRPIGEFIADIQRPTRSLYRIALSDSAAPGRPLLITVVHRPEPKAP